MGSEMCIRDRKKRFEKRRNSPLIFWKFSENDLKVADRWDAFTFYKDQMFSSTSHEESPWVIINANTKMVAALNSLRYILEKFDYPEKNIPKPKVWSEGMNIYILKSTVCFLKTYPTINLRF